MAHLPASATVRAVYSVWGIHDPHEYSCSSLLFVPPIGGRTPHPRCRHTHTRTLLALCGWLRQLANDWREKKNKNGLDSSRVPFFCCIRIRGPARICCNWLRRHFLDGGGAAGWLSCSNVASFYFFLSLSFGIPLSTSFFLKISLFVVPTVSLHEKELPERYCHKFSAGMFGDFTLIYLN